MMIDVTQLFTGTEYITPVWIASKPEKALVKFIKKGGDGGIFAKKLKECALNGLLNYEGTVLVFEGKGVYRFGIDKSLFRIVGFFDTREFIVIDSYMKKGQGLNHLNRESVAYVAGVKAAGNWTRNYET